MLHLFESLEKKAVLITANTRLAQHYLQSYAGYCIKKATTVFETPAIFSYDVWVKNLWSMCGKKYFPEITLITAQQSSVLWEEIIQEKTTGFSAQRGITDVKKAWKLCHAWEVELKEASFCGLTGNVDTTHFFYWASAYQKRLKERNWIDLDSVLDLFKEVPNAFLKQPYPAIIVGFDFPSPRFLKVLEQVYLEYCVYSEEQMSPPLAPFEKEIDSHAFSPLFAPFLKGGGPKKVAFLSEKEELQAVATWMQQQEPNKIIGCVIPNLDQKRSKIDRILQHYFDKETYNISAGILFSEYSMIAQALKVMELLSSAQSMPTLKDFYFLLNSRYWGKEEELCSQQGEKVTEAIHQLGNELLSWRDFLSLLKGHHISLANELEAMQYVVADMASDKKPPSVWSDFFQHILNTLGWPGPYTLDSTEYQTYQRWLDLLEEYQQLDLIFSTIPFQKALHLLRLLAGQTIFQPQKKNPSRIHRHFLGMLEAAGLHFDALWIMGMNDDVFPSPVQFNPFIPRELQRQQAMPHATHEGELSFAQQLMGHFMASSPEIICSYLSMKEGILARESPLIKHFPESSFAFFGGNSPESCLEIINDSSHIPQKIPPNPPLKRGEIEGEAPLKKGEEGEGATKWVGGASVIKNQALCPFKAFAKHRLKAQGFEVLHKGLNERDRGNLVHYALEFFWRSLDNPTQAALLEYTSETLNELIQESAQRAIKEFLREQPNRLTPFNKKLEVLRLTQLLTSWINFEKERPAFTVQALEENCTLKLSELELHLRIDRIDRLSNGDYMVIDYKTGQLPSVTSMLSDERPENPQLLLYALSDPAIKAWAFAKVSPSSPEMKGQSATEEEVSGVNQISTWHDAYRQWERRLIQLADEFLEGKHTILPKKETTCEQCDLHGLCRIQEKNDLL